MRSWKTPALLATVGLCGLGSLFAQGPLLLSEPTPLNSPTLPMQDLPAPISYDQPPMSAAPVYESSPSMTVEQPFSSGSPVYSETPVYQDTVNMPSEPVSSCEGCAEPVSECCGSAPAVCGEQIVQSVMPAPQVYVSPVISQPSCGCHGGDSSSWGVVGGNNGYGMGYAPGYGMGSGSGVSSGVLSPNANSGGLHTRYPYYNYRHPWHYQGPPSQNVTIVW